jgi:hypothetical protein
LQPVSLFAGLDDEARREVADEFSLVLLAPGDHLDEVPGGLVVVGPGRAELTTPDGTRPAAAGDVVGVRAALGAPTRTVVEAHAPTEVWVLGPDALDELVRRHASIGAARAGRSTLTSVPTGTLVRATLGATPSAEPRRTLP